MQDRTQEWELNPNQHTSAHQVSSQPDLPTIGASTDGSCFQNRDITHNTPAGWGYPIENQNREPSNRSPWASNS